MFSCKFCKTSKVKESWYITFVVSRSIKKLVSVDCVSIYFPQLIVFSNISIFSTFFSIDFAQCKSVGLPKLLISWFINFKRTSFFTENIWAMASEATKVVCWLLFLQIYGKLALTKTYFRNIGKFFLSYLMLELVFKPDKMNLLNEEISHMLSRLYRLSAISKDINIFTCNVDLAN